MKRTIPIIAGALLALVAALPVSAGPTSGTTVVPAPQTAGTTMVVTVTIDSIAPVVPFEYAIQNECSWGRKATATSYQRDDIIDWTIDANGLASTTMPIHLQSIPAGARCKVFMMRGSTQVKGSVTSYTTD